MPGLRNGARRLDRSLREAHARLALHLAGIERAAPVDVHQARVASRRMRSLLKTFRPYFDRSAADECRRDLRRVARKLAPLRELDVTADLPGSDTAAVDRAIVSARQDAASRMRRWLKRSSGRRVLAVAKQRVPPKVDARLDDARVDRTIRRLWLRIEQLLEADPTRPEELHALRIKLKNIRYAIEATAKLGDGKRAELIARLRTAQSLLGEEHDVACARAWLKESSLAPPDVRATLRQWQRRSRSLEARRRAVLGRLRRAGRSWYRSTR